jgi:uncharacterized OB-fold protein
MVGADDRCFWDGVAEGRLLLQRCSDCGRMRHPPRPMCPACTSLAWETFPASGRGTVHSYVIPHAPVPPGFDEGYVVALIELEEGARLVSSLTGVEHDAIRNDLPVEVVFEPVEDGTLMHRFRPA